MHYLVAKHLLFVNQQVVARVCCALAIVVHSQLVLQLLLLCVYVDAHHYLITTHLLQVR